LLVFPLLCHLIPQVCKLGRQLLYQLLGLVQLALKCFQLVLLSVCILHLQGYCSQPREPVEAPILHHRVHITLWTCELGRVFHLYQDYEPQIVPHVVFFVYVILKSNILVVKVLSLEAANEAGVFLDFLSVVLFRPEICKRIDDNSEDEVEDDDDDNEEEEDVVENPNHEERIFARRLAQNIPNSTSVPQALVHRGDQAHEECVAASLLLRFKFFSHSSCGAGIRGRRRRWS